jgi:hypothetical protein
MRKLLILALASTPLMLALQLLGQTAVGLLAPDRFIDWSNAGAGTIPARTTICTTLTSTATPAAVQSALSSCPSGQTVLLGAGTYSWSSSLVSTASNVTLRGAGPNSTKLVFSGTSTNCLGIGPVAMCLYNGDSGSIGFTTNVLTVTAGMAQGATSVTVGAAPVSNICGSGSSACSGSLSNLHVGSIAIFNQLDDASETGNALFNGSTTFSQQGDGGNVFPGRSQIQVVTVTGIAGSTVTFTPALYAPNWSSGKTPLITFSSSLPMTSFGLEDLTVDTQAVTGSTADAAMIQFIWATNSWIKNVAMVNATTTSTAMHKHVWVASSNHITIRDSYEYGSSPSSEAYGVDFWQSGDSLAENNICQKVATCEILEGGAGNVFGYHYAVDNFYDNGDPQWQQCDQFHHNAGDYYNLFEGNIGTCHTEDSIHGTAFANTIFRNALSGFDPSTSTAVKTQNLLTINTMGYARYLNYVGNVLGYGGHGSAYSYSMSSTVDCGIGNSGMVFLQGDTGQIGSEYSSACYGGPLSPPGPVPNDVVTNAGPIDSSMIFSNWDAVTAGVHSPHTASGASTYPGLSSPAAISGYASLYLPSQPSWWAFPSGSVAPFPGIGSDVIGGNISSTSGHAWLNPANNCYKNVLGGLTNGSSTALAFDANSCYTGTSYSLTITSAHGTVSGPNCASGTYPSGTIIGNCGAAASLGYSFTPGWSGTGSAAGATGTGTASFTLTANSTLTANYTANSYTLSTTTTGTGTGTITGCAGSHVFATAYSCTANVISGTFASWSSTCGGTPSGATYSGNMPASSCTVTATFNAAAATPTFSPVAGPYGPTQNVTILDSTPGAVIHFTTDGSTPTSGSTTYTTPIPVAVTTTVKALAIASGYNNSPIGTAVYTINGAAATPTASPAAGTYASAQSVTLSSATSGASIYYTTDGSTPTTSSALYTGAFSVATSQTVKAIAAKTGFSDSSVLTADYVITGTVAVPTFAPPAGSYGPTQTVTLSTATGGASIVYTTDGSTPTVTALTCTITHGTLYSGPLTVSSSQTIKAVGCESTFTASGVGTAAYTINGAVATPTFSPVAGTYTGTQTVTVSSSTSGAALFYTTDGSTPNTGSTPYTTPIIVSVSETVKVLGTKAGFTDSAIASAAYTINPTTTTSIISGKAVISGNAHQQ